MFEYFRELEKNGGELIVTDYGKPVLRIERLTERYPIAQLFSAQQGKVKIPRALALESTASEWESES